MFISRKNFLGTLFFLLLIVLLACKGDGTSSCTGFTVVGDENQLNCGSGNENTSISGDEELDQELIRLCKQECIDRGNHPDIAADHPCVVECLEDEKEHLEPEVPPLPRPTPK